MHVLKAAKLYMVEYSNYEGFYQDIYAISELMHSLGIDMDPEAGDECGADYEVSLETWCNAILKLIRQRDQSCLQIDQALCKVGLTRSEAIETMRGYLQCADTHDGFLHLTLFR